VHYTQAVNTV